MESRHLLTEKEQAREQPALSLGGASGDAPPRPQSLLQAEGTGQHSSTGGGREALHLAVALPLSSDTSAQGWSCQLRLSEGYSLLLCGSF